MLTTQERIYVVLEYHSQQSVVAVQRKWQKDFSTIPPSDKTITSLYKKFKDTGSVLDKERSGRNKVIDDEKVIEHFENQSSSSIRRASTQLDISVGSICIVLHKRGMKPYRLRVLQQLSEEDFCSRKEMCDNLLQLHQENNSFLFNVFWSDEATFHLNGCVNRHNCIIWAQENPNNITEIPRVSPKVNVWVAFSSKKIIGPFFFPNDTVTAADYLEMLQSFFVPELKRRRCFSSAFFQQDGAPPHWGRNVREFFNANFKDRWIGRGGWVSWAPRSPDLAPPDFFLWGFLKNKVYGQKHDSIESLKRSITAACNEIDTSMLQRTVESCITRFQLCSAENGQHIEQLL